MLLDLIGKKFIAYGEVYVVKRAGESMFFCCKEGEQTGHYFTTGEILEKLI